MSRGRRRPHRYRRREDFENHDRWLVSYADFITLLFAFFVVMYAISQVNESKYRVVAEALVGAFGSQAPAAVAAAGRIQPAAAVLQPSALPPGPSEADLRIERAWRQMKGIADDVARVMAPLVERGYVRVTENANGVAVEINASVLFEPGEARLDGESADVLRAVGQVLAGIPNQVRVEGHTDDTPIRTGTYPSNWELSSARASSVVRLFVEQSVQPGRLSAVGYGEHRPLQSNDQPEGRARNRRVTIFILPVPASDNAGGGAPAEQSSPRAGAVPENPARPQP